MFNHLFAALKAGKASDQQRDIAKALVVAFKHVPQPQILDLIDPFLVAVKESKDSGQLSYFADGLPVIVSGIAETQAYPLAQKLSVAILNSDDQNQIDMLCHSLIAVASRLMPENAAEVLFKALDNPLSPRDKLTQAIREKFPDSAPKAEQGYWSLIAWGAEKQLSHL